MIEVLNLRQCRCSLRLLLMGLSQTATDRDLVKKVCRGRRGRRCAAARAADIMVGLFLGVFGTIFSRHITLQCVGDDSIAVQF